MREPDESTRVTDAEGEGAVLAPALPWGRGPAGSTGAGSRRKPQKIRNTAFREGSLPAVRSDQERIEKDRRAARTSPAAL